MTVRNVGMVRVGVCMLLCCSQIHYSHMVAQKEDKKRDRIFLPDQEILCGLRGMYSVRFNGGASDQETSTQVQSAPYETTPPFIETHEA